MRTKNTLAITDLCVMKAKGIPKKCLSKDFYSDDKGHEVEFHGLRRYIKKSLLNSRKVE